ncbi:hypothetical protein DY218_11115 [Streptomyces triticagri]|uniref:Uncharacterized protein n=1 Tax=Streptomyces triticagri TaxID=2293568 RepID=A0A372M762_9ACTN|nr:hypothetical protein DY218_11115 [Streptomyces triticagri]
MHHLVDRLSPTQVRRLRLIITQDEELSRVDEEVPGTSTGGDADEGPLPPEFLAMFGSIDAPADYAERHDDYIRDRMERDLGPEN